MQLFLEEITVNLEPEQAITILSKRGDQIAKSLDVEEGVGWRDNTGTAHLLIRGAFQSLERLKAEIPSIEDAGIAIGTVVFAGKSPEGFLGENTAEVATIAMKILQTEIGGGSFEEAITVDGLKLITSDLQKFTMDIMGVAGHGDADSSLKAFAEVLGIVNEHYQNLAQQWQNDLKVSSPVLGDNATTPKPKNI